MFYSVGTQDEVSQLFCVSVSPFYPSNFQIFPLLPLNLDEEKCVFLRYMRVPQLVVDLRDAEKWLLLL